MLDNKQLARKSLEYRKKVLHYVKQAKPGTRVEACPVWTFLMYFTTGY